MKNFRFMLQHWKLFLIAVLTGIGASLLEGLGISFIFPILQDLQTTSQALPFPFSSISGWFSKYELSERLQIIAVLLILITMTKSLLKYSNVVFNAHMRVISVKHFRMLCFKQFVKLGMGDFNNKKMGDIHTLFTNYSMTLGLFVELIGIMFPLLFNIIIYLCMISILSWQMTLISLAFAILVSIGLRRIMYNAAMIGKAMTRTTTDFNSTMLELLMATKIIHLFAREQESMKLFETEVDHNNNAMFRSGKIRGIVQPIFEFLAMLMVAVIMLAGSVLFFETSSIGLPGLVTFLIVFQRISGAAMTINQYRVSIIGNWPAYQEIFLFLESEDKQYLDNGSQPFSHLEKGIELKQVEFSYREPSSPVLKDISFHITQGTKVGIVGGSGAGKSTLTELLLRFYDPQVGEVFVDGVDLRLLDIHSWRKRIGVVSQDIFLFNDTVRANIAYAVPNATQEEIEKVAHQAYAHDFIIGLPNGYDTLIGDRGVLLSGGQKQRLAIARAIMPQPNILILDEATSALDTESEKIVQQALDKVSKGRTVITIAHRLSTIFDSDNIIVMDSGRIVEQGKHQELMQKNGTYRTLLKMQETSSSTQSIKIEKISIEG
jgi:ATP-binding cassette, subfamily B, bacterial MsbA